MGGNRVNQDLSHDFRNRLTPDWSANPTIQATRSQPDCAIISAQHPQGR
jgi:hypothetical protein